MGAVAVLAWILIQCRVGIDVCGFICVTVLTGAVKGGHQQFSSGRGVRFVATCAVGAEQCVPVPAACPVIVATETKVRDRFFEQGGKLA